MTIHFNFSPIDGSTRFVTCNAFETTSQISDNKNIDNNNTDDNNYNTSNSNRDGIKYDDDR